MSTVRLSVLSLQHKTVLTLFRRHIVVCGHITYESVSSFIKNFIHEDADNTDINVVLVDK